MHDEPSSIKPQCLLIAGLDLQVGGAYPVSFDMSQ